MATPDTLAATQELSAVVHRARNAYAERLAGNAESGPWWDVVILTASSEGQAERYREEIRRRQQDGKVPDGVLYLVAPDQNDKRIGSGGATLNAIRLMASRLAGMGLQPNNGWQQWWATHRVLLIHCGGDSRRLPQYSLSGKVFSAVPVKTPWGEVSTVFDEMLLLSTDWAANFPSGLLVSSGDVVLTFDASQVNWNREGVVGVGMKVPSTVGTQHGVYVTDPDGRVYSFLQKPSIRDLTAAGGLLPGDMVAVDTGLLRFAPTVSGRLTELALTHAADHLPEIDLYQHITMGLNGQWAPAPAASRIWHELAAAIRNVSFSCSVVAGDFTHVGTTHHFRQLVTQGTGFPELYEAQQRLGASVPEGMRSSGVVIDSVLSAGADLAPESIVIECDLRVHLRAGRGAIVHGLTDQPVPIEVPENIVVHQVPVTLPDGLAGVIVRVYGVEDDPKKAVWFGRPIVEAVETLGLDAAEVWPGIAEKERTLWNAQLFPIGNAGEAWECGQWMMGVGGGYNPADWGRRSKLSLESSARHADTQAVWAARSRRMQKGWQLTAESLTKSGADIRPLLAHAPGIPALIETARAVAQHSKKLAADSPTEAASGHYRASMFFAQAGWVRDAEREQERAFALVQHAVDRGTPRSEGFAGTDTGWHYDAVTVSAPPRIDLGGGWSDTPPFCLDWGGTVLNIGVELNGQYPIKTLVRRIPELVLRCVSGDTGEVEEYQTAEELLAPAGPGCPFAISRTALQMSGLFREKDLLREQLSRMGGGVEIRSEVDLPLGSGLGTSSILAATTLKALAEMVGQRMDEHSLSDHVMSLEQLMTTGGGWQDQAGAIFAGAKLISSGPGLRQRLRVQSVDWTAHREAQFHERLVLYYTGIQRMAKNLLREVVGSYLAREVESVQVLHSIKTLAVEMAYAMKEGDWRYLGQMLDRHWQLNQVLDPNTTNAPINSMLAELRPYIAGAKLAGAGGGGFLILLARGVEEARALREYLTSPMKTIPGSLYDARVAKDGLRVERFSHPRVGIGK